MCGDSRLVEASRHGMFVVRVFSVAGWIGGEVTGFDG